MKGMVWTDNEGKRWSKNTPAILNSYLQLSLANDSRVEMEGGREKAKHTFFTLCSATMCVTYYETQFFQGKYRVESLLSDIPRLFCSKMTDMP